MRKRKLKVYGGYLFGFQQFSSRGARVIVAAHSWQEAGGLVNTSPNHLRVYWSVTGNEHELKIALAKPLVPFFVLDENVWQADAEYQELRVKEK